MDFKVVDPIWLEQSNHPNAAALRQAKAAASEPECWGVFHRVTYVSRILPDYAGSTDAPTNVEQAVVAIFFAFSMSFFCWGL